MSVASLFRGDHGRGRPRVGGAEKRLKLLEFRKLFFLAEPHMFHKIKARGIEKALRTFRVGKTVNQPSEKQAAQNERGIHAALVLNARPRDRPEVRDYGERLQARRRPILSPFLFHNVLAAGMATPL